MKFGCLARFYNPYKDEVEFAKKHYFDFMQLWYDDKGLALKEDTNPLQVISNEGFETIIHAVLDINDFDKHIFSDILKDFDGKIIFEILDDKEVAESRDKTLGYMNR